MGSSPSKTATASEKVEKWAETIPADMTNNDFVTEKEQPKGARNAKVSPMISPNEDEVMPRKIKEKKEPQNVEKIKLTEGIVQDYVNLEKDINKLERKNVIKKYESQTIYADNLKNTVEQLEAVLKELKKQTEREKSDLTNIEQPSVKDFLKQQGTWEERLRKEKTEYTDAVSKQETVEKELRVARLNYENAQKIMEIYKQQTDNLYALYDKQDKMLCGIFGTDYASEKENVLEGEVDDMIDWQQRVSLAMFKWANGRVLLVHALTQITFGINRWIDAKNIEKENPRGRYFAAAEARNNFIAAAQNVQSCRMYLNKVEFPYATEEEIQLMEETVTKSFKNVQDDGVLDKAQKVFQDTQQKVASLIQWFDKVINDTIRKDLDQANNAVIKKQKALREERLSLMRKQCKQELGRDIKIKYDEVDDDELEKELKALEQQALKEIEALNGKDVEQILNHGNDKSGAVPLAKLAPIPTKDALFGDVKQKMSEHDNTRKQFEKRNNLQREKQAIALQEKLKMRQQKVRRTRKQRRDSVAATSKV